MTEEEKIEIADAFRSYDWIISYTNPIAEKLYLHNTAAPPYIEKRVNEYKEGECTRYYIENRIKPPYILSSMFINRLLLEIVREGIPLYKVGNKEISCVADIKRLWNAAGVTRTILEYKELYQIAAYLEPQRLKIEKKLMLKLKPEKKGTPASTPQDAAKVQGVTTFPLSPGTKVSDIKMIFLNDRTARITVKGETRTLDYAQMGFSHKQTGDLKPLWYAMLEYAEGGGARNVSMKIRHFINEFSVFPQRIFPV